MVGEAWLPRGIAPHLARDRSRSASAPLLSLTERYKSPTEFQAATLILEGYKKEGAVKQLPGGEGVKHLVPWFIISKPENGATKHRLISDCRESNNFFQTPKFRLDNIQQIFPYQKKVGGLQSWI